MQWTQERLGKYPCGYCEYVLGLEQEESRRAIDLCHRCHAYTTRSPFSEVRMGAEPIK